MVAGEVVSARGWAQISFLSRRQHLLARLESIEGQFPVAQNFSVVDAAARLFLIELVLEYSDFIG